MPALGDFTFRNGGTGILIKLFLFYSIVYYYTGWAKKNGTVLEIR